MGSTERRLRKTEEMQKILEATRNLFASRRRYDAVTLRKVADSIEYCPATIYKYFKDEEMVRALMKDDIAMTMRSLPADLEHETPLDRLRGICTTFPEDQLVGPTTGSCT